jgi:hypothetical protein
MDFAPRLLPPVPVAEHATTNAPQPSFNFRKVKKLQFADPKATATEVAEHTHLLSEFDVPEGVVTPVARTKQYAHGAVDTFSTSYRYRVHYAGATQWFSSRCWLHVCPVCATLSLSACMNSCCVVCQHLQAQSLAMVVTAGRVTDTFKSLVLQLPQHFAGYHEGCTLRVIT